MKLNMTLIAPVLLAAAAVAQAGTPDQAYWAAPGDTNMPSEPPPAPAPADRAVSASATATNITIAAATALDTSVNIKDFAFAPSAKTITVGTTVHWKNLDGEPHTVRSIDATFRSDPLDQNDSYSVKFDKPGTYKYACSIHPQMVGTIVVTAAH